MNKIYRALNMPKMRLLRKLIGHKEKYVVCGRFMEGKSLLDGNTPLTYDILFFDNACWYADPIVQEVHGETFLFVEQFDLADKRGCIAYSYLNKNCFTKPVPVIVEQFHMSFPYVFRWNDDDYMLPETSEDDSIRLYRAVDYPTQWELVERFETTMPIVDSVVFKVEKDRISVLASETNSENALLARFVMYSIVCENGVYKIEFNNGFNDMQEFNYRDRNAGRVLQQGNKSFLVLQESTKIDYGVNLRFSQMKYDGEYCSFEDITRINSSKVKVNGLDGKEYIGIHSYASTGDYEIIDLRYLD